MRTLTEKEKSQLQMKITEQKQEQERKFQEIIEQKGNKLPLPRPTIIGEILAGVVGGIIGGLVGMVIIGVISDIIWGGGYTGAGYGILIGFVFGSSYCVYRVGSQKSETGSYLATLSGGILGALLTLALTAIPYLKPYPYFYPIVTPICATIGFNLTRRYK